MPRRHGSCSKLCRYFCLMHMCVQAKADKDALNHAHKSAQQAQGDSQALQQQLESALSQQRAVESALAQQRVSESGSLLNGAEDAPAANGAESGVSMHAVTVVQMITCSQGCLRNEQWTMQGLLNAARANFRPMQ